MATPETHVGFPDNAPADVVWNRDAFVREVALDEISNPRPLYLSFFALWIGLLLAAAVVALVSGFDRLDENIERGAPAGVAFIALGVSGLLVLFLHGFALKWLVLRRFAQRRDRLFVPDWRCVLVEIESAETFHKVKLLPEDLGLLRAGEGRIELEMIRHRARFPVRHVQFALQTLGKMPDGQIRPAGVTLEVEHPEWPWHITVVPMHQSPRIWLWASPRRAAQWLIQRINEDLSRTAPPAL